MKKICYTLILCLFFMACTANKDYDAIAKEDNLSSENKDFLEACDRFNNIPSCIRIFHAYEKGKGAVKDINKGIEYAIKACDVGIKEFQKVDNRQEFDEFIEKFDPNNGNLGSNIYDTCGEVAEYYEKRYKKGLESNTDKIKKYKQKQCDHPTSGSSDGYSCLDLAKLYKKEGDFKKAKYYAVRGYMLTDDFWLGQDGFIDTELFNDFEILKFQLSLGFLGYNYTF